MSAAAAPTWLAPRRAHQASCERTINQYTPAVSPTLPSRSLPFSIMAAMNPSRRAVLGSPRRGRRRRRWSNPAKSSRVLAADVPCAPGGPAGELLGTLPLFRDRSQVQAFGSEIRRRGTRCAAGHRPLAARAGQADHPERSGLHPHRDSGGGREHQGPWTLEASGLLARPAVLELDDSPRALEEHGPAPVRVFGQRQPVELRLDERRRMGRHSADRGGLAAEAHEGGHRRPGQRLRSHRPVSQRSIVGASWMFPLASLDTLGAFLADPR